MDQFYQKNQEYPIIIWTDSQISNWENKLYCEKLQTDYQNAFQAFNDISEAIKILQKIGDKDVTILTSGQYAYQLVKHTKKNIIVFCGRRQNHLDLFMNNFQIQSIVSDSFQSAHENVIMSMNYSDIQNQLIKLLSPPQQQSMEYQHSKYHVSIQFLVAIEEIKEEKRPNQQDVFGEIENLLIENKQQKMSDILKDLDKQEQKKKKKTNKNLDLFEKFIYIYSRVEIYKKFNQLFAQHDYQPIKNIIACLYQGFKDNQSKEDKFQNLFRGTSFDQQGIFQQIIKDLNQSRDEGASIFWNTIASASQVRDVAKMFAKKKEYGILYEITLDKDAPHPFFQLQDYHSHFSFEFIVQEITFTQEGSKQIYTVKIKQVKNNYAFALDPTKRKIYWDSIIEQKIKPKIDTLVNFQSKRIFELISFSNQNYNKEIQRKIFSSIETELENTFQLIHNQLQQIFFHSKYPNIVNQITSLTKTYTEIVKCRDDYQSAEIAKLHIDQVMKSLKQNICTLIIKGIIDIECQKEYLQNSQQQFINQKYIININNNLQMLKISTIKNNQFKQVPIGEMLNNGGIEGVAGSLIVDLLIDGPEELQNKGLSTLLGCIPYVGVGFSAIKFIASVCVSDFLSESEKVYHCTLMAIKSGGIIGLGCLGYQGGAALGSLAGPAGIIFGSVIGGMIGGATGNLLGRAIDNSTQFSLKVDFSKENKSIVKNGYLINPGKRPHIRWAHVKDMVNSLILIGQTEKQVACVIPNISRNLTAIDPDQDIGIELIQYKYLGPDDSSQKITFRLLATTHDNINDSEVLEKLIQQKIQIIDIAEFAVNLKCM